METYKSLLIALLIFCRQWQLVELWKDRPDVKQLNLNTNTALRDLLVDASLNENGSFLQAYWDATGTVPTVDLIAIATKRSGPSLEVLQHALNNFNTLNAKAKKTKRTLLHYSALNGCPDAAALLLDKDLIKLNEQDDEGNTPLHYCFTSIDIERSEDVPLAPRNKHLLTLDRLKVAKTILENKVANLILSL
jgi:hypothetical protein